MPNSTPLFATSGVRDRGDGERVRAAGRLVLDRELVADADLAARRTAAGREEGLVDDRKVG